MKRKARMMLGGSLAAVGMLFIGWGANAKPATTAPSKIAKTKKAVKATVIAKKQAKTIVKKTTEDCGRGRGLKPCVGKGSRMGYGNNPNCPHAKKGTKTPCYRMN